MDSDLLFVAGLAICVISVPAIFSAFLDGRAPRTAAYLMVIGGLMVGYAVYEKPNVYALEKVPDVLVRVIGRYTN